jgi:hypothetical protein
MFKNTLRITIAGATGVILQTVSGLSGVEGFAIFFVGFVGVTLIWYKIFGNENK